MSLFDSPPSGSLQITSWLPQCAGLGQKGRSALHSEVIWPLFTNVLLLLEAFVTCTGIMKDMQTTVYPYQSILTKSSNIKPPAVPQRNAYREGYELSL